MDIAARRAMASGLSDSEKGWEGGGGLGLVGGRCCCRAAEVESCGGGA